MERLMLTPQPAHVHLADGVLRGRPYLPGAAQTGDTLRRAADLLCGACGGDIAVTLLPADASAAHADCTADPEGYALTIDERGITIAASTPIGYLYGCVTLRQIINECGADLPHATIADKPVWRHRGAQVTYAQINVAYRPAYLRHFLDQMAMRKINTVYLYIEWRYQFPSIPETHNPDYLSPDDVADILAYAAPLGITIVPSLNMMGHTDDFLAMERFNDLMEYDAAVDEPRVGAPRALCPTHPGTRELVARALGDIMDAFPCEVIHVGGDEVALIGGCPRCAPRKAEIGVTGIYAEYYGWIRDLLVARGRRMGIWGDMISHYAGVNMIYPNGGERTGIDVFAPLREGTVIFDWCYDGPSKESIDGFIENGFEIIVTTSVKGAGHGTPWLGQIGNMHALYRDAALAQGPGCVAGGLVTDWINGYGYHSAQMGMLFGAAEAMMWQGIDEDFAVGTSRERFLRDYALQEFGCRTDSLVAYWHASGDKDAAALRAFPGGKNGAYMRMTAYINDSPLDTFIHYATCLPREREAAQAEALAALEALWARVEADCAPHADLEFMKGPVVLLRYLYDKIRIGSDLYEVYDEAAKAQYADRDAFVRLLDEAIARMDAHMGDFDAPLRFATRCRDVLGMDAGSAIRIAATRANLGKLMRFLERLKRGDRPLPTLRNLDEWLFHPKPADFWRPRNDEWAAETGEFRAVDGMIQREWGGI